MALSGQDMLKNWEKEGLEGVEARVKTLLKFRGGVMKFFLIAEWNCTLVLVILWYYIQLSDCFYYACMKVFF